MGNYPFLADRDGWQPDLPAWKFIGSAILKIGKAKYGDTWSEKELLAFRLNAPFSSLKLPSFEEGGANSDTFRRLISLPDFPLPAMPEPKNPTEFEKQQREKYAWAKSLLKWLQEAEERCWEVARIIAREAVGGRLHVGLSRAILGNIHQDHTVQTSF